MYLEPISIYYLAEAVEPLVVKLGYKWLPGDRDSTAYGERIERGGG